MDVRTKITLITTVLIFVSLVLGGAFYLQTKRINNDEKMLLGNSADKNDSGLAISAKPVDDNSLDSVEKFGIGTKSPTSMLQISNPTFRGILKIFDNQSASHGHDIGYDGGIDGLFWFSHFGSEYGETKFIWNTPEKSRDLLVIKNTGNIGIGVATPVEKLDVSGGIKFTPPEDEEKPNCEEDSAGTMWYTRGKTGVKDKLELCAKDKNDNYFWRRLY